MAKKWSEFTRREKVIGVLGSVFGVLVLTGIVGAASGSTPSPAPTNTAGSSQTASAAEAHKPVITTKDVSETFTIPFASTTVDDGSKASGTSSVTTQGVNGVDTKTYTVTYSDGTETGRVLKSDVVTTLPVTQVTTVGTYVAPAAPSGCTNGTYVNSAGNTVCSPESSTNGAPGGATAQCQDGTYSFSQSRSGTCSHHGGVATWL